MTGIPPTATWLEHLMQDGYCIIPDLLPASVLSSLEADLEPQFARSRFGDGYFYGHRTKRLGGLLKRSPTTACLVLEPTVRDLAQAVLAPACERIQLNVAQAIEIHPGELEQFPHCDHDMWAGVKGHHEYLLNVMWPLSRFTEENGATRIYPGTHRRQVESLDELDDPVVAACEPGSAICFLGSTVHGAGANRSALPRRGVVIGYSLGWLKPYENLWLAYPPAVARTFSPELAELAGYVQHRPNLGNYEGQCPSILLGDDVPDLPRPSDALRPDQEQAVREYADRQSARE